MKHTAHLSGAFLSERYAGRIARRLRLEIERHSCRSGKHVMDEVIVISEDDLVVRLNRELGLRKGVVFLRDHMLGIGITKISAGSNTAVGGYSLKLPEDQDPQFDTEDKRSVAEIVAMVKDHGFDPVFTDWRPIENKYGF